jgi:hypothetical protein
MASRSSRSPPRTGELSQIQVITRMLTAAARLPVSWWQGVGVSEGGRVPAVALRHP